MRTQTLGLQLALATILGFNGLLSSQTFQTVDALQLIPGLNCNALAMGRDPVGNIYAAGYMGINYPADSAAALRMSSDGGATWNTIDLYGQPVSAVYQYNAFTSDSAGNLYAAGSGYTTGLNSVKEWFVRRSSDGGATWSTVDNVLGTASGKWETSGAAADAAGNVYVVGRFSTNVNGTTVTTWGVRKGTAGTSWSTVDLFNPGSGASAAAVLSHPAGVFVYGSGSVKVNKKLVSYGYVRRSQDGGANWTTIDTTAPVIPSAMGADAAGNIYVVGQNAGHWIVRKSANAGTTWTTLDDFQMCVTTVISTRPYRTQTTCYNATPMGFAEDAFGNLFVAGVTASPTGTRAIVRKSAGGIGPWQTVDDFQHAPGKNTFANDVVADDAGHVFVGGSGLASSSAFSLHWLVRRN